MREIIPSEVSKLRECLTALAEHHNQVSVNFKGSYPKTPIEQTLKIFEDDILQKGSRIAVIEYNDKIVGFCKADIKGDLGIIEYLVVLESYRGQGYGAELMNWAMKTFESANTRNIEVKVADGNNAVTLYEKYGFKMNAHILKLYR